MDKVLRREPWDYTADAMTKGRRGRPRRLIWTNDEGVCMRRIPRQAFTRDQLYKLDPEEYQEVKEDGAEIREQGRLFDD